MTHVTAAEVFILRCCNYTQFVPRTSDKTHGRQTYHAENRKQCTQLYEMPGHGKAAVSMMGSPLCQRALQPFPPAWPCALLVAPPILVVAALACSTHDFINLCHAACTLAYVKRYSVWFQQSTCALLQLTHQLQLAVSS